MRRFSLLFLAAALLAVAIPAQATPALMKKAEADKKDVAKKCAACHVGAPKKDGELNELGKSYKGKK